MRPALGILMLLSGLAGCDAAPTDSSPAGAGAPGSLVSVPASSLGGVATPPAQHQVYFDDPSFALPDIDCGTFIIRETSFSDRVDVTTYFNAAGDPVSERVHVQLTGVLTNLSNGKTLRDHASFTDYEDFAEGTLTEAGVSFHYTLPHEGLLVTDNGRLVFDSESGELLFAAGSHDVVQQGHTAICPLLA